MDKKNPFRKTMRIKFPGDTSHLFSLAFFKEMFAQM